MRTINRYFFFWYINVTILNLTNFYWKKKKNDKGLIKKAISFEKNSEKVASASFTFSFLTLKKNEYKRRKDIRVFLFPNSMIQSNRIQLKGQNIPETNRDVRKRGGKWRGVSTEGFPGTLSISQRARL